MNITETLNIDSLIREVETGLEARGFNGELISPLDVCVGVNSCDGVYNGAYKSVYSNALFMPMYFYDESYQIEPSKFYAFCFAPQVLLSSNSLETRTIRRAFPEEIKARKRLYKNAEEILKRDTTQFRAALKGGYVQLCSEYSALKERYVQLCCEYWNETSEADIEHFSRRFEHCFDPMESSDRYHRKSWGFGLFMLQAQMKDTEQWKENFNASTDIKINLSNSIEELTERNKELEQWNRNQYSAIQDRNAEIQDLINMLGRIVNHEGTSMHGSMFYEVANLLNRYGDESWK